MRDAWLVFVLGPILAAGPVFVAVAWATRRFPRGWARSFTQVGVVPTLALAIGLPLGVGLGYPPDRGDWRCLVCATEEHRVTFAGLEIRRSRVEPGQLAEYRDWFAREVAVPHDHDWERVGRHRIGDLLAWFDQGLGAWFYEALPRSASTEVAVERARELALASSSERRQFLRSEPGERR